MDTRQRHYASAPTLPRRTTTTSAAAPPLRLLSKASTEQALPLETFLASRSSLDTLTAIALPSSPIAAAGAVVRRAFAGSCLHEAVGVPRLPKPPPLDVHLSTSLTEAEAHERVVRAIHAREQLLSELRHLAHVMISLDGSEQQRAKLGSFLLCLRVLSANVATAVRRWRQRRAQPFAPLGSGDEPVEPERPDGRAAAAAAKRSGQRAPKLPPPPPAPLVPAPFVWRGHNYLIKMLGDVEWLPLPMRQDPLLLRWFDECAWLWARRGEEFLSIAARAQHTADELRALLRAEATLLFEAKCYGLADEEVL